MNNLLMLVWLFQLVVGEIIYASEMTKCEGKLPCDIPCDNFSCYLENLDTSLEFNTSCTYFVLDIYIQSINHLYPPHLLNDDKGIIYARNPHKCSVAFCRDNCKLQCIYEIGNQTKTISTVQIKSLTLKVNYFECLLPTPTKTPLATPTETPKETPLETPLATPTETLLATPKESPLDTPFSTPEETPQETLQEIQKEKSSNNNYIIGFTIGLGGPVVLGLIFLIIMLRYRSVRRRVQKSEEEVDDNIQFPEEDSKKDEQDNPLYEIHLSHDPFEEKSIEE